MNKISNVIWDWNGTLMDDVDICIESMNKLLLEYNCSPIKNKEVYRSKFCFPIEQYYRNIGFDFSKASFSVLGKKYIDIYQHMSEECKLKIF